MHRLRSNSILQSFDLSAGLPRKSSAPGFMEVAARDGTMFKIGRKTKRMTKR